MLAIDHGRPKHAQLKDAIDCYIEHRREVIIRRTRFLLGKGRGARRECSKPTCSRSATSTTSSRSSATRKNRDEARERLAAYTFTTATAEAARHPHPRPAAASRATATSSPSARSNAILELRLYQLTGLERDKVKAEYDAVLADIKDLLDILAREERVLTIIKDELRVIKAKYATPRLTRIDAAEAARSTWKTSSPTTR